MLISRALIKGIVDGYSRSTWKMQKCNKFCEKTEE